MRSTRSSSTKPTQIDVLKKAVSALKKTNIAYLATHTPVTSSDTMPKTATRTTAQLYTVPNTTAATLTIEPKTQNEVYLLAALREAENWNACNEVYQYELQASNILNEAYTERLRKALETKEEKRSKRRTTKLVGDGLPRVLTGDKFYELAVEKGKEIREVARQKEARKDGRSMYKTVMEEWKVADQKRKEERDMIKADRDKTIAAWEKRKAAATKKGRKFTESKPKSAQLPKAIPKPKLKDFLGGFGG